MVVLALLAMPVVLRRGLSLRAQARAAGRGATGDRSDKPSIRHRRSGPDYLATGSTSTSSIMILVN